MNRSTIISSIAQSLSRFKSEVEILNKVSLYDINLHSENVLIPFLNTLYDSKLNKSLLNSLSLIHLGRTLGSNLFESCWSD